MSDHNEAVMVAKGMSPVHVRLRSRLASLLAASVALDLVASVVIDFAEQGQSGTGIKTFGDALFWTSTQLLTVSSNLPNPLSTPGANPQRRAPDLGDLDRGHPGRVVRGVLPPSRHGGPAHGTPRPGRGRAAPAT
jgi:hypothetical protein